VLMNITAKLKMFGLPVNGMDSVSQKRSASSSSEILLSKIVLTHGEQKLMRSSNAKKHIGLLIMTKTQAHQLIGQSMLTIPGKLT
jgi:hypothetical protein